MMGGVPLSEFADKMNELMPTVIKEFARRQTNELYKGKITLPQFLVLAFLAREGESKMTILARFMGVSTAAMTGIVERLVRDNYALRLHPSADRRIIKVKLTSRGAQLVSRINAQRKRMILNIFGEISGQDRQDYLRILMQIKDILIRGDSR
jgi:DNA-binding MarR family transcriptional regulator